MSFWTDVTFVRPEPPPHVTVGELIRFTQAIAATGIVENPQPRSVEIKVGRAINSDMRDTNNVEQISETLYRTRPYPWDITSETPDAISALSGDSRQVYRAYIGFDFGSLRESISQSLQTQRPDNGEANLIFADVSVRVDVLCAGGLETDTAAVGWIGVGFGGYGYLYPWSPTELIRRVRIEPILAEVERVCRSTFPVALIQPGPQRIAAAREAIGELGEYWPYGNDAPADWAWAISETG